MIAAALITVLILLVEHWFPWRLAIGRDLPKILAYAIGVAGLLAPISVVWWLAGQRSIVFSLWAVVMAGGVAVALAYGMDWMLGRIAQARDLEQIEELHHGRGSKARYED